MATYVLIHGAGDSGWSWHLLEAELRDRGHDVVAPDLPSDDAAGLPEYADTVAEAVGDRTGLVVVAQSYGGFTAPLVCDRLPADLLVLLAAMVPRPAGRPDDWWANPGPGRRGDAPGPGPVGHPGSQPWPLPAWPDVPTRFLLCRDDRFFPADFLRRVVQDRLAHRPGRDRRQPLRRPQPPSRAGRPPGVVPGRAVGRRVAGTGLRGLAFSAWPRRNRAAGSTQVPAGVGGLSAAALIDAGGGWSLRGRAATAAPAIPRPVRVRGLPRPGRPAALHLRQHPDRAALPAPGISCTRWWCRRTRRRSTTRPGASGPRRSSSRGRRPRPCPG